MKKLLLLMIACYWSCAECAAQSGLYKGVGTVVFEAGAPLSLIKGTSEAATGTVNLETGKLHFDVPISSFEFLNSLMHERFNNKYMNSHRHRKATFTGEISERKPTRKSNELYVTATGILSIHGVARKRTIKGLLIRNGNTWQLLSDFAVNLEDHHIEAPKLSSGYGAYTMQVSLRMLLNPVKGTPQQTSAFRRISLK